MDPNQPPNQALNNPAPPAGNVSPVPPTPTPTTSPPSGRQGGPAVLPNSKIILFIVIGILLLIVFGVTYFLASQLGKQNQAQVTPTPTQALPTSTPTPTPLSEKDIDTIDLGNPEADLKGIEDDVKQL